jgi:hypothetical protein
MIKSFIIPVLIASLVFPASVFANTPEPPATESKEAAPASTVTTLPRLELKFEYSLLKADTTFTPTNDVYLLTPASFAKIYTDWDFRERQYTLEIDYLQRSFDLRYSLQAQTFTAQNQLLTVQLQNKNEYIERIEPLAMNSSDKTWLWVVLGVGIGVAGSIGIMYAVKPGINP